MDKYKDFFIMVAEDDEDDRLLLQTAFDDNGYNDRIEFVLNGVDMMARLNILARNGSIENLPVFILLDLNMPRKDGREVLNEIKKDIALRKIPVVVFSAAENMAEIRRCYENGANSYVVKPNSYNGLIKIVQSLRNYWFETVSVPG